MVVGKKERHDLKAPSNANLIIRGERYQDRNVYTTTKDRKRRDVFAPDVEDLPETATVVYRGNRYTAELSFRTTGSGAAIPVYEYKVSSNAPMSWRDNH